MSRGDLTETEMKRIAGQIPDLSDLQRLKGGFAPDMISLRFPHDSWVPVAGVALIDAIGSAEEANHALHECLAHRTWYMEHKNPPQELAAAFLGRFYATDLALRLHAGAEHLANAIIFMLEIGDEEFSKVRRRRANQASNVGQYLMRERSTHPITAAILPLSRSVEWRNTLAYRANWTHNQPPTIAQLGMVYRREKRWAGNVLRIGGSDIPDYRVDDLLTFMTPACQSFVTTLRDVTRWYIEHLARNGYALRPTGDVECQMFFD